MSAPSLTFTVGNQFAITHQVSITTQTSELAPIISIVGSCRPVNLSDINNPLYEPIDRLASITIDGETNIQGDQKKMSTVFERVQRAIQYNTGKATMMGKNLVVVTGQ